MLLKFQTSPRGQQSRASGNDEQKAVRYVLIQCRYNVDTILRRYRYDTIPKIPKNTQKYPKNIKIPVNTQKYSKVPKSTQKISESTLKYLKYLKKIKYPKVP